MSAGCASPAFCKSGSCCCPEWQTDVPGVLSCPAASGKPRATDIHDPQLPFLSPYPEHVHKVPGWNCLTRQSCPDKLALSHVLERANLSVRNGSLLLPLGPLQKLLCQLSEGPDLEPLSCPGPSLKCPGLLEIINGEAAGLYHTLNSVLLIADKQRLTDWPLVTPVTDICTW